jgi:hypothetical protein
MKGTDMKKEIVILSAIILAGSASASLAQNKDKAAPMRVAVANPSRSASATPNPASTLMVPAPEAMVIMIRSSLLALSQANLTNNYSVLSGLGSAGFKAANSPERLAQLFQSFRANQIDMNPVVYVSPQQTHQPAITGGKLRLIGIFPTAPMRVNYDLSFEPEQGVWKLQGISVNLAEAQSANR